MRKRLVVAFVVVASFAVSSAFAADKPSPKPAVTVVKAARLLDVVAGRYVSDRAVVVENGKIKAVIAASEITSKAPHAVIVDLGAKTLLPGFIDCHNHVLGDPKDYSPTQYLRRSSPEMVLWGVHNLRVFLDHGFTGVRDAGEPDVAYGQIALRDGVKKGLVEGPRLFCAGNFVSLTGGHGDVDVLAPDQALARRPNIADTPQEVALTVRRDLKYGADWIKLMATGGVLDPFSDFNTQELSEEQMRTAVEIAHRAGRRVMAHAEGTVGIKAAVRAGVDSVEHGTVLDEEGARMMAEKGTWLVPTLYTFQFGAAEGEKQVGIEKTMLEKGRAIVRFQAEAFKRALDHKVKIAFGLDMDPDHLPDEFDALVRGGMTPLDAIRAATMNAAQLLGAEKEIGSIEEGKTADLVAVEGDPLADVEVLRNVSFVMREGRLVKGAPAGAPRS